MLAALIAARVGIAIGLLISCTLAASLARLSHAARSFAAYHWDQRVVVNGTQEMAEVAVAFNDMADSLQQAELLRRNLVADMAHELRTPLTVLQGNLRAILGGVYPLAHEEIATLYDGTRLLNRLVDNLREVALAEARQLRLNVQPIDLGVFIDTATANLAAVAEPQHIAVTVNRSPVVPLVRRCRSGGASAAQFNRQCAAPYVNGTLDHDYGPVESDGRDGASSRYRRGHRARRSAARLRSVLSQRQIARATQWWQRLKAGDCQVVDRCAGWTDRR